MKLISVPCICGGPNSFCVLCSGSGELIKKACIRCDGVGKEPGNVRCVDCRGVGWRDIDQPQPYTEDS